MSTTFSCCGEELGQLFSKCLEKGLLIVETGELETVFGEAVPYRREKKKWLPDALEFISSSDADELGRHGIVEKMKRLIGVNGS